MTGQWNQELPDFADLSARIYRLSLGLLGNEADASDAAQEALTRAWDQRSRKRERVSWWTWVGGFAVRVCRESRRRRQPIEPIAGDVTALPNDAHESTASGDDRRMKALHGMILRLPDRQREVLILRVVLKRSTEETARVLECPLGTVKSNLHKAIQGLHGMQTSTAKSVHVMRDAQTGFPNSGSAATN